MDRADSHLPSSSEAPGIARSALVGRAREQQLLRAQLNAVLRGQGSTVILGGEAGIGKSRLAEALRQEAAESGALVLDGHCYDHSETPAYGPWTDALEQYAELRERSPQIFPIAAPSLSDDAGHRAHLNAMRDFCMAMAREQPLVLVLEDVQWADAESLELMRFVARRCTTAPVLLLLTYRNDEVTRDHPLHRLVPALVREALAVRIDIAPLSDVDVRLLIVQGYGLPEEDAARLALDIQQRADGNPFFIGELLRSLEGSVLLPEADGSWRLGALERIRIPVLLRQVIDQRLARLGDDAERLLVIASMIGPVVPLDLWFKVAEVDEGTLLDQMEKAIDAHLMTASADGMSVLFSHELLRDALYDGVSPPRRRGWHLRIVETLLALEHEPDPDQVAFHLTQAGDPRAVEWLTYAGERAQRAFAWRTALQRYQAALELAQRDQSAFGVQGWLRFRLALLGRFDDPVSGIALLEDAERLGRNAGDQALVAYARFYQGMLRCQSGDLRHGIAAEQLGIALLDALSSDDRARLALIETTSDPLDAQNGRGELTLAMAENGRLQEARTLGERIVSLPSDLTEGSLADAWYGLGFAYAGLGDMGAASDAFGRARAIFVESDYRNMVAASLFDELMTVLLVYRTDDRRERSRFETQLQRAFAALDESADLRSASMARVVSAIFAGEWDGVIDPLLQSGLRYLQRWIPVLIAPIARFQGDSDRAWSMIHQRFASGAETAPDESSLGDVSLRSLSVLLALDAGDSESARQWLESFERWLAWSGSVLGQADVQLGWAAWHRAMGDLVHARQCAVRAIALANEPRQPLALMAAHRLLGEIESAQGELATADEHISAALALGDAIGASYERALTLLAQAELRARQGNVPAAQSGLDSVRAICRPMQAALILERADALEATLRGVSPISSGHAELGLTAREGDVLRLLATGLSNAEIAGRLSLSPRTIDTHLTSIYAKIGVTSRGAAIRFALEHGLEFES